MQFNRTADGGMQILWSAPSIVLTGSPRLTAVSPAPLVGNGDYPTAASTCGYGAVGVTYVQFGTDPANVIYSKYGIASQGLAHTGGDGAPLSITGGQMVGVLTAAQLADARAAAGLYAIGFIGIPYNDGTNSGTLWLAYDYGTTAQSYQSSPPGAPGQVQLAINGDQLTAAWVHAQKGTAPLAGYTLKWGPVGGPYPNSEDLPIALYPPASTSQFVRVFDHGRFAFDDSIYEFVVQAYDDGSAPVSSTAVDPHTVSYFPPALGGVSPVAAPGTPPTNPPQDPPQDPPDPPGDKPGKPGNPRNQIAI